MCLFEGTVFSAAIFVYFKWSIFRQFIDICKRLTWNGTMFIGKESCPKMTWNWNLSLFENFIENLQRATIYEIWNHWKAFTRTWKLIYLNLHITTKSRICRWSFTYLINSKEAVGKACEIWLKLRLHNGMATFQTLQTWIGHNATRYHTRYHVFFLRFPWFLPICNNLPSFFWKTINIWFL